MIHGTTFDYLTWCGEPISHVQGWSKDYSDVECIACLRAKVEAYLPQTLGRKGGKAGKGSSKVRGDSAYYKALRAKAKPKQA